ncbi:binding-protein-dependent transport systems inner membrane component [Rubrobacter xylanophilus DSM 9941]|uniref:Binding-protein-dependent transport systems inner membrane component n=1 Tax=Rubrobacter xylanophilus (strain DSM 9941 / JCM 11954 / NBRC 16129 / PRD-1) TaxID=266117 RepID=Q1ARP1_RUBXD|nr:binding-protein-dependent transport systems inner membrane component [Rubrobacter xylanophilus DSM 9941]
MSSWGIFSLFILVAVAAPLIAPYDPTARGVGEPLLLPLSEGHLLGTDAFGRDQFSRLVWGSRPIIAVSLSSVALAAVVGSAVGLLAGYVGGILDLLLLRAMDALLSFPLILLAIMIVAALGPSLRNTILAIAVALVPIFARLVRALALRERSKEYVLAARAGGFGPWWIMLREIAPNVIGPVIVQAAILVAVAAGYSSALSYLGLGTTPPTPDWGYMVKEGQEYLFDAPDLAIIPGLLITAFATACSFIGDDLRDVLDPDRTL